MPIYFNCRLLKIIMIRPGNVKDKQALSKPFSKPFNNRPRPVPVCPYYNKPKNTVIAIENSRGKQDFPTYNEIPNTRLLP